MVLAISALWAMCARARGSLLMLLVAAALLSACGSRGPEPEPAAGATAESPSADTVTLEAEALRTVGVQLDTVKLQSLTDAIVTTGVVEPNATRVAHIRLLAPGRVEEVFVRVGDRVRAGQPLLIYDNIELGSLVGEYLTASAAVERSIADADVSQRALDRATKLVEAGGLSRAEYERRDADYKRAVAEVATQRAAVANVQRKLQRFGMTSAEIAQLRTAGADTAKWSDTTVRAPFSGVVTAANVALGESVDTAQELLALADLSTVWIVGDIYQKDIASVRQGQTAEIGTESYAGETFHGRITNVSDVLDPATRTAKVRIEVPNRDGRLKVQMFVTARIPTTASREAIVVPTLAVQELNGKQVVFVPGESSGQFVARPVTRGPEVAGMVTITDGLKAGDRVVVKGAFQLKAQLTKGSFGEDKD